MCERKSGPNRDSLLCTHHTRRHSRAGFWDSLEKHAAALVRGNGLTVREFAAGNDQIQRCERTGEANERVQWVFSGAAKRSGLFVHANERRCVGRRKPKDRNEDYRGI